MATIAQAMGEAFGAIMAHVEAGGAQYAGPPFALYPDEMADEFDAVICMPVAPGATGGRASRSRRSPAGAPRRPCTRGRTPRSARPTTPCRSG